MTPELWLLVGAIALAVINLAAFRVGARHQAGDAWTLEARALTVPTDGLALRMMRARDDYGLAFPLFAAAIIVVHLAGASDAWSLAGAHVFFWSRLVYLGACAADWLWPRLAAWLIAKLGLLAIVIALVL